VLPPPSPATPAASSAQSQHLAPAAHPTRGPMHNTRGFLLTSTLSKIYNLLNVTEFALEMRDGISSRASCVACNAVVGLFLSPLYSKEVFSAAIRTVCISFRIQSARVCAGLVESFQDDFEYIRKNTKLTRDEVCGVVFGVDCARRQTYNLFWTVPIPDLPAAVNPNHPTTNNQQRLTPSPNKQPISNGDKSPTTSSSLSIPLDEHSLTSMEDAPDLFEYRKSSAVLAAAASSTGPSAVLEPQSSSSSSSSSSAPSSLSLSTSSSSLSSPTSKKLDDSKQLATTTSLALSQQQSSSSPDGSSSSSGSSNSNNNNNSDNNDNKENDQTLALASSQATNSQQAAKKAAKMLKRPQYIFDDERLPNDGSDQSLAGGSGANGAEQRSSFVHITDIHIDPYYEAGSLNECNEPLCCRATSGPVAAQDKRRQAGRWGDYGNCDVPIRTLRNALNRIREQHSNAEYWLWTGDISPHDIWNITKAEAANHVRLVTKLVRTYSNGLPVFPVIGNHEAHPVNSFSPPEIKGKFSMSWLYDLLADEWSDWLPEDALKTLRV
jgi:hypothetical protein